MDNIEEKIVEIVNEMSEYLAVAQLKKLQEVILRVFTEKEVDRQQTDNDEYLRLWLEAKKIEGCSEKTLDFYGRTVRDMFMYITTSVRKITTEDLRSYLSRYQRRNGCTNVSLDNIRRNLSSFFNWLAEENHILKSPMTRIHPHMFRRSMATRAIDKGMPIEQVQQVLGHSQIGTTMHYALVSQQNVKISHQKFIG